MKDNWRRAEFANCIGADRFRSQPNVGNIHVRAGDVDCAVFASQLTSGPIGLFFTEATLAINACDSQVELGKCRVAVLGLEKLASLDNTAPSAVVTLAATGFSVG